MSEVLISIHVEKLPEGVYVATSNELPGLVAEGRTVAETLEIAQDLARHLIEIYQEEGMTVPCGPEVTLETPIDVRIPVTVM